VCAAPRRVFLLSCFSSGSCVAREGSCAARIVELFGAVYLSVSCAARRLGL
ncbi:hypothetical protein A2U01_0077177, partial [Trifolium medium]|nr:hypothetical protein [Trifolium medium]